jgi:SAM-dependent MidA family methyltransferase
MPGLTLPEPEPAAQAHSEHLCHLLRAEITAHHGSLPFNRFMELALYAPGSGYYSAGLAKLGSAGDFVTAPEISSLFSRCLAQQCREILQQVSPPGSGMILELGAGSGIMAVDILQELAATNCLPERYFILEVSAELRQRQQHTLQQRIPQWLPRVQWLSKLPEAGFRGVVLGNEVLDAMPVQRFRITSKGPCPLCVGYKDDAFYWHEGAPEPMLSFFLENLQQQLDSTLPIGYESEYNPYLTGWLGSLSDILEQGAILMVDYGYSRREYYHPQRDRGTLICHYRHRAHDNPLIFPGLQDISASVDFTAVAEAAKACHLELAGYTRQNYFLFGCGLEKLLSEADPSDTRHYLELTRQVKLLTLPSEMGEHCKAIALTRNINSLLCGFSFFDERERL